MASAQPEAKATVTPMSLNVQNDALLAGPVEVQLSRSTPTDIGITLKKGIRYYILVQGIGGYRSSEKACDPLFIFTGRDTPSGYVKPLTDFRFTSPKGSLYDLASQTGCPPTFSPAHTYGFVVEGQGEPLQAFYNEKGKNRYGDNSGAFTVRVYPEPQPVLGRPAPKSATPPKPDADAQ